MLLRSLLAGIFVAVALFFLCTLTTEALPRQIDLIQYWSGAQLYLSGGDPYSEDAMASVQSRIGLAEGTIQLWNPPLIFPLIVIAALFDFSTLRMIWFCLSAGVMVSSLYVLLSEYRCYSFTVANRLLLYVALLTFVPFFEMLGWGQVSAVLLIGVLGWWLFFRRQGFESYFAGVFLSLTLIKPHLLLPIYVLLVLQSFQQRHFRLLVGFLGGGVALSVLPLLWRADIWSLYLTAMSHPPLYWRTPNLGSLLQGISGIHTTFIRHFPLLLAVLGCLLISQRFCCGRRFKSRVDILLLLPISLLVSPYGWIYDQVVLLPWIFHVAWRTSSNARLYVVAMIVSIAQLSLFLIPSSWGQERGILPLLLYSAVAVVLLQLPGENESVK